MMLMPACLLSRAWEGAGKLGRAEISLGSGQTCPTFRVNFNVVNLSGRGRGCFGRTWLCCSCSHKTYVIEQVGTEQNAVAKA